MTDEELEKKAEEYAHNTLSTLADTVIKDNVKQAYITGVKENGKDRELEEVEKQIEELDKENAELKAFRQDCIKLTEDNIVMTRQRAETSRKLTKAREIIKRLMHELVVSNRPYSEVKLLVKDVEQFLEEIEK